MQVLQNTENSKAEGGKQKAVGRGRFLLSAYRFPPSAPWDLGLGILAFALYALTLSPGLLPADSGEYQLTGALLGVAHPPGYALYTIVSWLTTKLFFFLSPAVAINLLSAILAALTLVMVSGTVRTLTGSTWAGVGAAAALGCSTTFWAQATTANIRMPTVFAIAWAVERLVVLQATPPHPQPLSLWERGVSGLMFALGLAVSHHGSTVFVAAVLGLYALWLAPRAFLNWRVWLMGALPFAAWLYFPLRAGAYGAPPNLNTLAGFLQHILARGFQGDMLFFATAQALPERLALFGNILTFQFAWPVLAWMAAGAVAVLWRKRSFGVALLVAWAVHVFIAITYRAPQTVEYLLPAYGLMAVWMGCTLAEILAWAKAFTTETQRTKKISLVFSVSLWLIPLMAQAQATAPSYFALARDTSTRDYTESLLHAAPPDALILANWHWATPLWYLQHVEGMRADVEVRYVFPRTASLAQDWLSEISAALPARPVLVTSFYPQEFNASTYRFIPFGPAWEVNDKPVLQLPDGLIGGVVIGKWQFLGHSSILQSSTLSFFAAWSTSAAPQDINFYVHLIGSDGLLYGQMDVSHSAAHYMAGEVLLDRYTLTPFADALPGEYTLVAGAYWPNGARVAETAIGTIRLQPSAVRRPPSSIPLGDAIQLISSSIPARSFHPGDEVTVTLNFLAIRPILNDYTVSVSLTGPDYGWRVLSDGTPASGAIPSLKWIAGSRITDRHTLTIPARATPGPAQLALVLYDAFTQQPLPILDRGLAAQGVALPLGTIEVAAP